MNFPDPRKNNQAERRAAIVQLLNKQLADTLDLRSQARQAVFNVRGPYRAELHALFDQLAQELRRFADSIVKHICEGGGYARATIRSAAQDSGLRDYVGDVFDGHDFLQALLSSYSRYERDTLRNIKAAQEIGDAATAALLQAILASIGNSLWFLEAYLEGIAIRLDAKKLPVWTSLIPQHGQMDVKEI